MKISIITVCFNSADTIKDTLESVIGQSYENIEYIVVDGASKDDTLSIINGYKQRIGFFLSEPDEGIYDAMNKGIQLATGDFVGILNSDDILSSPRAIQDLVDFLTMHPHCDGAYANLVYVQRNDTSVVTRSYNSKKFSSWKMRYGLMPPHPTLYLRRALFETLGYYKLGFRVSADFELMARFISRGVKLLHRPVVMVKMRNGGVSNKSLLWRVHQNMEIVKACRQNGIYTNIFLVALKLPLKLASLVIK